MCSTGPLGRTRAISTPLADSWAKLEAARLLTYKGAWLYDQGEPCGGEANAAKYLAGEFAFEACERAVLTHGGMGYAKEFHVERLFREIMIARIAPISRELVLSYIGERQLGPAEKLLISGFTDSTRANGSSSTPAPGRCGRPVKR